MKLVGLIFAFVIGALVVVGIIFASASLSTSTMGDTYGSAASAGANATTSMLEGVTGAGTAAGAGIIILLACLGVLGAVGLLRVYAGR